MKTLASMTGAHFRCYRSKSNQSPLLANVWTPGAPWDSDLAVCTHTSPKGQLYACVVKLYSAGVATYKYGRHMRAYITILLFSMFLVRASRPGLTAVV